MFIEDLQKICLKFPSVTEDIKRENHLCFNIGGKMFLITGLDMSPTTASFKVTEEDFTLLSVREGFKPAPYLARYKWVHVDDINRLSHKEWEKYLKTSYQLVKSGLPKKIQKELEI
ncbi:MAG: MmcQ/YjbR family DNA-binding protein [Bacteroidota bacterium]|nr:MmcQ/YjbR family DNA-binding protein [Bacteroidota bacterium]